jgi:hypothetical protein
VGFITSIGAIDLRCTFDNCVFYLAVVCDHESDHDRANVPLEILSEQDKSWYDHIREFSLYILDL